ncbi:uncharacterized protein LOC143882841 [Tasmannia lanceolata]|uniref:uncharacterized protein LOC143882841 n=1 Tax=Tasmannia lanceolata TaxID=3420 RepID=UPI004063DBB6
MVDLPNVCCMCGDVGFPDKLFRCNGCSSRFQHSYCSNYYDEVSESGGGLCDWCRSEIRSSKYGVDSKRLAGKDTGITHRSEYSGDKIKQSDKEESSDRARNITSTPSPRPPGRRYKLLKDVLC